MLEKKQTKKIEEILTEIDLEQPAPAEEPMRQYYFMEKEKLNKVDIVGFLIQKGELYKEDIGMIDIKDHYSYVAINRKKINRTLRLIRKEKIKNMKSKYEIAR